MVDEFGVSFWRNDPGFFEPRFNFVFFSVCLTVSWEMFSTISSSTMRWAKRRNVQRDCPSGGWLQAIAIRCASCSPSRRCDFLFLGDCRLRAASIPCSTNNLRTRSIVGMLMSKAMLIARSVQLPSEVLVSAFRRIRA